MIERIDIANVLFIDIECVASQPEFSLLNDAFKDLWKHKARFLLKKEPDEMEEEEIAECYKNRAAIYAEFGKIICISVGIVVREKEQKLNVRLKSFAGDDEGLLLREFAELLNQYYRFPDRQFICGHNVKEFDIPYICRRMVVHSIPHPPMLQLHGKKPWETKHLIDTMELWKFGDGKNFTSLKLLAAVLGFQSPKDDIDGSDVGRVYWEEKDIARIAEYCEKDVLATVQLLLRFMYMPLLEEDQVKHVG